MPSEGVPGILGSRLGRFWPCRVRVKSVMCVFIFRGRAGREEGGGSADVASLDSALCYVLMLGTEGV